MPCVLVAEPDADVRQLLELTIRRLGYEVATGESSEVDAVLLEPACAAGQSVVRRFGDNGPPVVCFSIYPREEGLAPPASVAYLLKPSSPVAIAEALRDAFGVQPAI